MAPPAPNILVVENDRETRSLIAKYLRDKSSNLTTATDARQMPHAIPNRRHSLLIHTVIAFAGIRW